eukprot:1157435-Rhodomonas_salina.1
MALSQLLAYRKGEFDLEPKVATIQDEGVQLLVRQLTDLDPTARGSGECGGRARKRFWEWKGGLWVLSCGLWTLLRRVSALGGVWSYDSAFGVPRSAWWAYGGTDVAYGGVLTKRMVVLTWPTVHLVDNQGGIFPRYFQNFLHGCVPAYARATACAVLSEITASSPYSFSEECEIPPLIWGWGVPADSRGGASVR